jgi:hypothetical protein
MPTGYTHKIKEGQTFNEFVLSCARAMGALVMMRDEPMDTPIPDEFPPSDYSAKQLKEYQGRLTILKAMPIAVAGLKAREEYDKAVNERERDIKENADLKNKYNAMLAKVEQWKPPTADHVEFKHFMMQQIKSSIEFDCHDYKEKVVLLTGEKWLAKEINECLWSINYHTEENNKEIERSNSRTEWIKALKKSLQ